MGESREVAALRQYIADAGLSHRVTSTIAGRHARTSRHYQEGTDGRGLAADFAGPKPGDRAAMLAIFQAFSKVGLQLRELIYKGPAVVIHGGKWVDPVRAYGRATIDAHADHVHVSVDRGRFVRWPGKVESAAAEVMSVPIPVHDYEEATVKSRLVFVGPLDDRGNGWSDWQVGLDRDPIVVGLVKQGPSPPDDGNYWDDQAAFDISAQPRNGSLRVVVRQGKPGDTVGVWAAIA